MQRERTASLAIFFLLLAGQVKAQPPTPAVGVALADARGLAPSVRVRTRYLLLPPGDAKATALFVAVLNGHVNSLSRRADMCPVRLVAANLVSLNLDDYQWKYDVWEAAAQVDPYFHATVEVVETYDDVEEYGNWWVGDRTVDRGTPGAVWKTTRTEKVKKQRKVKKAAATAPWLDARQIAELSTLTSSTAPILRADWFIVQTCRQTSIRNTDTGLGYYDFLQLKKRADLFKLIDFDEKRAIEFEQERRAALDVSGVSQQNRQIAVLKAYTGWMYTTLDVKNASGAGNAVENLPRGSYKHDAEETYAVLRNGLPVFWLGQADGTRQDSAPDFIGPNDSPLREGKDGRIHVCVTCWQCHGARVLQPIDDWARKTFAENGPQRLTVADADLYRDLRRQYLSNLDGRLERDRQDYIAAIKEATGGLEAGEYVKGLSRVYNAYVNDGVSLETAARDVGTTPGRLKAVLIAEARTRGRIEPILAAYLWERPGTLPRVAYEDAFPLLAAYAAGVTLP